MAHVVTSLCYDCRYTDCVVVCPVECFYADEKMLYIDPDECIDCEACVTECPAEAIYLDLTIRREPALAKYIEDIEKNEERATFLKDNDGQISDREKPIKGAECITVEKEAAKKAATTTTTPSPTNVTPTTPVPTPTTTTPTTQTPPVAPATHNVEGHGVKQEGTKEPGEEKGF